MSIKQVIFKVKFNNPNHFNKSSNLNRNNLIYIAKRPNSVHNFGKAYSLFGSIKNLEYNNFGDINNLNKVENYIEKISKEKTTIYKSVISLDEETAFRYGYDKRDEWEKLVKNKAREIAYNFNIPFERFEYVTAFHIEKGHPHIHLMFWDNNQKNYRGVIPRKNLENISKALNKYVFEDILKNLYLKERDVERENKIHAKNILNDIENSYLKDKKNIFQLPFLNLKNKNELKEMFVQLIDEAPKKGSFKYAYVDLNYKKKIDKFTNKLINNNNDLNKLSKQYIDIIDELKSYGIDKKDAEETLNKMLGNQVLDTIKHIKKLQKNEEFTNQKITESRKFTSRAFIDLLVGFCKIYQFQNNNNAQQLALKKDLSKQAKKEYAIKIKYKSAIDWNEHDIE